MRKLIFTLTICLLVINANVAQSNQLPDIDNKLEKRISMPKYAIGISPTSLLNFYPMAQVSQELRLNPDSRAYLEYGFAIPSINTKNPYGRRIVLGVSVITRRFQDSYFTLNASVLSRTTTRNLDNWALFVPITNATYFNHLKGVQIGPSYNHIVNRVKFEVGFGVGYGVITRTQITSPKAPQSYYAYFVGIPDEIQELDQLLKPVPTPTMIFSFHINVSYTLVKN